MAGSILRLTAVTTVFLTSIAAGQIINLKKIGNRTIACMHSGLSSNPLDCGTQYNLYAYVFVGSISAIAPTKDGEKELQIVPEEIFYGEPPNPLVVRTSQSACLPDMKIGDRWLFYLRDGHPIVLDFYGNISRPAMDAEQQIETLRRLEAIGDKGILRGQVVRGPESARRGPIPGASVIAHQMSDNTQFVTTTDSNGRYEFELLPAGRYKVSIAPTMFFHADDANINLKTGSCLDLTLSKSPHASLEGHVRQANGLPAVGVQIVVLKPDGTSVTIVRSDEYGGFLLGSLMAGKYLVGVNLRGAQGWKDFSCVGACEIPSSIWYYPGVQDRSGAFVFDLAVDQKRDDIDFVIPTM